MQRRGAAVLIYLLVALTTIVACSASPVAVSSGSPPSGTSTTEPGASPVSSPSSEYPDTLPLDRGSSLSTSPVPYDGGRLFAAAFTQPRLGRPVLLQRQGATDWETLAQGWQDSEGFVEFLLGGLGDDEGEGFRAVAEEFVDDRGALLNPVATSTAHPAGQWVQTFRDDFNGAGVNGKKWSVRQEGQYFGNRKCSAPYTSMTKVSDGNLRASVDKARESRTKAVRKRLARVGVEGNSPACPHGVFDNAMVSTYAKYEFRRGVVAAKMKFPKSDGVHASLWLQSADPRGAEIDIIETFGLGRVVQHKVWYRKSGDLKSAGKSVKSIPEIKTEAWWDQYHVVSLEWSKDEYVFRIDGEETFRTAKGISASEEYLIISLLSSDWELPRIDVGELPATLLVDWVQVWESA